MKKENAHWQQRKPMRKLRGTGLEARLEWMGDICQVDDEQIITKGELPVNGDFTYFKM